MTSKPLTYPFIDPVLVSLGPIAIHWYGVMYVIAFGLAYSIARYRLKNTYYRHFMTDVILSDLLFYAMLGTVIGGRVGYVLFYNFPAFIADPLWLFRVWEGGMSFHGGMLGVTVAVMLLSKKHRIRPFAVLDFIAPMASLGLFFGRIGNFIGGELYGKITDLPWGVVFPDGGLLPRHPTQLYEAFLEGALLSLILFIYSKKPRPVMSVSALLLIGYGVFRFLVEFVREPDSHIGYLAFNWVTVGQILSLPMIAGGGLMLYLAYKYNIHPTNRTKP